MPTSTGYRPVDWQRLFLTGVPIILFAILCWIVEPASVGGNISLAYLIPFSFVFAALLIQIRRSDALYFASKLKVEFALLFVLITLCFLSLLNLDDPIRAFRILFPSTLPFLIFLQLLALWAISPRTVSAIPKIFLCCGLIFASIPLFFTFIHRPLLSGHLFSRHRYSAFFENPNQASIVLATLIPLAIAEICVAGKRSAKILWIFLFLVLLYTLVRTGSKTALFVGLGSGWAFYIVIHFRAYSPLKRIFMTFGMLLFAVAIGLFGIQIAALIDPVLAQKLTMIFSEGVGNYYSIESRQELWKAAIEQGSRHWLIGTGAGETIGGVTHAHNLILDYFKGLGIFGALSILALCAAILFRASRKAFSVLTVPSGRGDKRVCAAYAAAAIYVVCNQLSDCFGPSTIGTLWLIYLPAVFSEHCANALAARKLPSRVRPPRQHPTINPNWLPEN